MIRLRSILFASAAGAFALAAGPSVAQRVSTQGNVPAHSTCFGKPGSTATCVDADDPLPVTIISGGGGGGGSGTEYTEDAAAAANPIGGVVVCVRRDTLSASEVSADGDNVAIKCTSKGEQVVRDADVIATLTTIDGRVDGLETAVASTNTKLDTLITDIGTLRTAIGTSASASDCDGSASLMAYQLCATVNIKALNDSTAPIPAGNNNIGDVDVASIAAGNNNIGDVDVASLPTLPAGTNTIGKVLTSSTGAPVRIVSGAANTTPIEIADSGGCTVTSIIGSVVRTTPVYVKFYNAPDGSVTTGTTTPYITLTLPAGGTQPTVFQIDPDQTFASGSCSVAFTTTAADNSTAAMTAGDIAGVTIFWKP